MTLLADQSKPSCKHRRSGQALHQCNMLTGLGLMWLLCWQRTTHHLCSTFGSWRYYQILLWQKLVSHPSEVFGQPFLSWKSHTNSGRNAIEYIIIWLDNSPWNFLMHQFKYSFPSYLIQNLLALLIQNILNTISFLSAAKL